MSRLYDKRRWRRLRARKLAHDPICEGCGERPSEHVDHIVALDRGGAPFDWSNLQALCLDCHNAKTACDKSGKEWRKPAHRGCDVDGFPLVPSPEGGGVRSLQPSARTPAATRNFELVETG